METRFFISHTTGKQIKVETGNTSCAVNFVDFWDNGQRFTIGNNDIQALIEALTYAKDHTTP